MTSDNDYNIHPLPGYILVKPYKEEKVGNFEISAKMSDKDSAGIVVAVGDEYYYYEGSHRILVIPPVSIGDVIIYQNIGTDAYMSFETGERLHLIRFHVDPYYSQIRAIIKTNGN